MSDNEGNAYSAFILGVRAFKFEPLISPCYKALLTDR